jgi:hypothetical protein
MWEGEAPAEPRFSNAVVFEARSRSGRDSDCLAIATTLQTESPTGGRLGGSFVLPGV